MGKLILFGAIFCCIDSALTIATCLSSKFLFLTPFGKKEQAAEQKKKFSSGNSDQLAALKSYKVRKVS
jgi:ATP-dependent RNA helicase DHX57